MRRFDEIRKMAAGFNGGEAGLQARLDEHPAPAADLASVADDRILSQMTRSIFQAGFVWRVIENKWDGFEAAFDNFDPPKVAFYSDEDFDRLMKDKAIVRNGGKIQATLHNARYVADTSREHGGFGRFLSEWPVSDQVGLLEHMSSNGKRLGGMTGQYVLRFLGFDAFILARDVNAALIREGVLDKPASGKGAMRKVQAAFNHWREESGLSQRDISRILSFSVGPSG